MLIDGKIIAARIEERVKDRLKHLPEKKVCFILLGNDPASKKFIEMKSKVALRLGVSVELIEVADHLTTSRALEVVGDAVRENYDGIVVQLPLPSGIDSHKVLDLIPDTLDIDALGSSATRLPPVAKAVDEILAFHGIDLAGKRVVVIGQGELVGKPVSRMLDQGGIEYSVVDKDTNSEIRASLLKNADVLITGAGVPHMVTPDLIKEGVVIIDAGTSESAGKLAGDVDPACADKASLMTPVPGGVGPVTVACLFANLVQ